MTKSAKQWLIDQLVTGTYPVVVDAANHTLGTSLLEELARGGGGLPEGYALTPHDIENLWTLRLRGLAEILLHALPRDADGRCQVDQAMLIALCTGTDKEKLARRARLDSFYASIAIAQMAEVLLSELRARKEAIVLSGVPGEMILVAAPA